MPVRTGAFVYPGNPEVSISLQQSTAAGAGANVSAIRFGSHTGTHVDAARHFYADGQPVDLIPLEKLVGPALLVRFGDDVRSIGEAELRQHDLGKHTRILLATRNSALLSKKDFTTDYTFLAPDGAEFLVARGVELVGIDYLSVEQFRSGHHRTHKTLLARSVVIVEGLDLSVPAPGQYELVCLPLRLEGCDGAPARAILMA